MDFLDSFDDRFFASIALDGFDYDAQLQAISVLITHHEIKQMGEAENLDDMRVFSEKAKPHLRERVVDDYIDHLYLSTYHDAAYSMSAVGMLAPFIEALFRRFYLGVRNFLIETGQIQKINPQHKRWSMEEDKRWNCNYTLRGRKNIVQGIMELANATGLDNHLPKDLRKTLDALFSYRNKMLHGGFEWEIEDIAEFKGNWKNNGWDRNWFSSSLKNESEWIFYITSDFSTHCLRQINMSLDGMGAFLRKNMRNTD